MKSECHTVVCNKWWWWRSIDLLSFAKCDEKTKLNCAKCIPIMFLTATSLCRTISFHSVSVVHLLFIRIKTLFSLQVSDRQTFDAIFGVRAYDSSDDGTTKSFWMEWEKKKERITCTFRSFTPLRYTYEYDVLSLAPLLVCRRENSSKFHSVQLLLVVTFRFTKVHIVIFAVVVGTCCSFVYYVLWFSTRRVVAHLNIPWNAETISLIHNGLSQWREKWKK